MSSILGFGPGGVQRFSRNSARSVTGEGVGAIRYPSPFFDIAQTYLPSSFKTMLRWCRYYFLSNPLINAVCYKMAEYPVTDLVFDTDNAHEKKKWSHFFNKVLQFKKFEVEAGLDYHAYGNAFISIFYPFIKYLRCRKCRHSERVDRVKYTFKDFKFYGSCRGCGSYDHFDVFDHHIRAVEGIRLIRWNPETLSIQHNEATGEDLYYYTIPGSLANDIKMAKRHTIERIPQIFVEALRQNKSLLFDRRNLFHMKRATIAQKDKGWGLPMILPVLKDTFYLQILRKAQETLCVEHIVPLRVLFPQSASGTSDVYCVSLDTLVETREGPLPAGEVKVGDLLKSHTGAWKKVEALADRPIIGSEKVYRFKVTSLSEFPFEVSEDHPILSSREIKGHQESKSKPDWVQAKDLSVGDYVLYPTAKTQWDELVVELETYAPGRDFSKSESPSGFIRDGYVYLRINEIAEAPEVKTVRGFQMSGDRSFCVVGVATHNSTINLQNWKQKVEQEILRWRLDNNYIPILPLPIGQQTLGAEGRALMLSQEYRVWAEHIVAGLGVPGEFVFGGLSYSGSNVSMRILENHFLDQKADHHALVDWVMDGVGAFMGWRPIPHHFRRFKMADDLQRSAFNLQLNQAGKLSDRSLLEDTDWDSEIEAERIAHEQKKAFANQRRQALSQAEIQGEAQLTMQKYQVRAQKLIEQLSMPPQVGDPAEAGMAPTPAGMPGMSPNAQGQMIMQQQAMMNQSGQSAAMTPPISPAGPGSAQPNFQGEMPPQAQSYLNADQNMGVDPSAPGAVATSPSLEDIAKRVAAHLDQMPDAEKQRQIVELRNNNPQLYSLVAQFLQERSGAHKSSAGMPQPQQRAPRRGPEAVTS